MRGRKPKPTHLKLIDGNPGKRPLNDAEPMPETPLGEPPEWMSAREKQIWRDALRSAPDGMVKDLDMSVFAAWVGHYSVWEHAKQQVTRFGTMVRTPVQNLVQQNPYLAVMNKQSQLMMKAAAELGFTPSARSRVRLDKGKGSTAFGNLRSLADLD